MCDFHIDIDFITNELYYRKVKTSELINNEAYTDTFFTYD